MAHRRGGTLCGFALILEAGERIKCYLMRTKIDNDSAETNKGEQRSGMFDGEGEMARQVEIPQWGHGSVFAGGKRKLRNPRRALWAAFV